MAAMSSEQVNNVSSGRGIMIMEYHVLEVDLKLILHYLSESRRSHPGDYLLTSGT